MTPELLRQVGEALYGPEWRMPLARDLGVAYQTMRRRWQTGEQSIPAGVVAEIHALLVAEHDSRVAGLRAIEAALAAMSDEDAEVSDG